MTITGRLTKDAVINSLKDERKVVSFSLAINESYKPKAGDRVSITTYCNCSYWISEKIAPYLKKGTLLELVGRLYVTPYVGSDGTAKASLNCHVSNIKILARAKEVELIGKAVARAEEPLKEEDNIPF